MSALSAAPPCSGASPASPRSRAPALPSRPSRAACGIRSASGISRRSTPRRPAIRIRTGLVLPSPGWRQTLALTSASNGTLAFDAEHQLAFTQAITASEGRTLIEISYKALHHLTAEGLFFRLDIPRLDFQSGEASIGWRSVRLPESTPPDPSLLCFISSQVEARSPSGAHRVKARLSRACFVHLQDQPAQCPRAYTFWVTIHCGNLPAGTEGRFEVELTTHSAPNTAPANLTLDAGTARYTLQGIGGNYCFQLESPVTQYTLQHLTSRWARAEMSLAQWSGPSSDQPGSRIRTELQLMRRLQDQGIPYVASVWHLPKGLTDRIQHISSYLLHAREQHGVEPDFFSFNEPDLGIHVRFTPEEHRLLLRDLGTRFARLSLKTKLLLGDVSNPRGTISYVQPTLDDPEALRYAGAVAFHSWGSTSAAQYNEWADLAERLSLPLLVTEVGADPEAYRGRAYDSYDYGLVELCQFQELLLHARPQAVIYWEFTADYALCRVGESGVEPTGRFWLTKHFTDLTPANAKALATTSDHAKVLITAFAGEDAIAIHIANLGDARQATLTGLPEQIAAWRPILTTEQQGYAEQPTLEPAQGALQLTLPARSLLTLRSR